MIASQDQYTQNLQNQYNAARFNTFSEAAAVAPIVLWSGHSQGNVYLAAKNTFLEFYTEERKAIKRHACARSASCDSSLKDCEQTSTIAPTSPTTNQSPSPSYRSLGSSDGSLTPTAEGRSRDKSPRSKTAPRNTLQQYQYQEANSCQDFYQDADYENSEFDGSNTGAGGYPMMMVPIMMPVAMPSVNEQEQEMQLQPKVVKPHMPSKKQDLRELNTEPVEEITTLMIRGIPCSFSQDTLMKLIDNAGLKGKYNFFYLPRAGNNGSNLGYAFINFSNQECAEHCTATFNGVPLDPSRSMKICTISPADIQGLGNLRKHFRRTAVSRGSRGPVFLKVFSEEDGTQ